MTIIYIGCHTVERKDTGEPNFKRESVIETELNYSDAIKIVRGLSDIASVLIKKPEMQNVGYFERMRKCLKELLIN